MIQKKPIIGITPSHNTENNDTSLRPTYPKAIAAAGGLPILLPLECSDDDINQFMDICDGLLFTGRTRYPAFSLWRRHAFKLRKSICCQRSPGISASDCRYGCLQAHLWNLPRNTGLKYRSWRKPVSGYPIPDSKRISPCPPTAVLLQYPMPPGQYCPEYIACIHLSG